MISRRNLVMALGASALTETFGAIAQQPGKVWRIGFLGPAPGPSEFHAAYLDQLRSLGYSEGRNLAIESRWAGFKQ